MTEIQIDKSIERNELILTSSNKFTHYGIVVRIIIIPLVGLTFCFVDLINGTLKRFTSDMFWLIIVSSAFGLIFYRLQKNRLKFRIVETTLNREELHNIIQQVAKDLKWTIITSKNRIVEAKTFPSFLSGSWGEQITILFDNNRVLVNSICDLEKPSSVVSMGRNKRNLNTLIEKIENENSRH